MKSIQLLVLGAVLFCSSIISSLDIPHNQAQEIARSIYQETVEQSIQDAQVVANIVGSIIIQRIKTDEVEIASSEKKKQLIIETATVVITPIIMRIINRINNRQNRRNRISSLTIQHYIDEIAEEILKTNENKKSNSL